MRRRLAGAGLGMVLAAMIGAFGAPAASAACPNEAFRVGPSAALPECRAYEQVTPVDKESGLGVWEFGGSHVSPTGDGIYFNSSSAYAGSKANVFTNPYVSERAGEAWGTKSIVSPQSFQGFAVIFTTLAVSDDLHYSLTTSKDALTPGAIPFGSNLYVHDNRTGAYTLVAALPGNLAYYEWTTPTQSYIPFAAATPDWSRILISSNRVLAPGGVEEQPNLYEFSEGRLSLVLAEAFPAGKTELTPNVMSRDGSRFFYNQGGALYMHRRGQEPLLVSEDPEGNPGPGQFVAATPDGNVVFFLTGTQGTLYRFEADAPAGKRPTAISPPSPEGFSPRVVRAYAGEDGTHVYFAAGEALTADAPPLKEGNGFDLYAWQGARGEKGQLRYLGQSEGPAGGESGNGPRAASVSPDGRFFGLESYGQITPDAIDGSSQSCPFEPNLGTSVPGRCSNVFLYSADIGQIACVTCNGSPPVGDSTIGGLLGREENRTVPKAVLDDGTIFFDTRAALVPRDADGVLDPYSWRDGVTQLISTGTDSEQSFFLDASADGADVFFGTQQSLVGQDTDRSADVYDARIGGGLPQAGIVATPSCIAGNACQAGTAASPPSTPASEAVRERGNPLRACSKTRGRARATKRRGRKLARQANRASGRRSDSLRKRAARKAKKAKHLGRAATACEGGNR